MSPSDNCSSNQNDDSTCWACFSKYDFGRMVTVARHKFIDKKSTLALLKEVESDLEKEEVMLVGMLDVDDWNLIDVIEGCEEGDECSMLGCRDVFKQAIISAIRTRDGIKY
ncbi:hypothetical protein BVY04_02985 [bacterium M21]|nr:hypothetical protein BVY04_02985 [bacterium M21]